VRASGLALILPFNPFRVVVLVIIFYSYSTPFGVAVRGEFFCLTPSGLSLAAH